jgi:hypothetical protein
MEPPMAIPHIQAHTMSGWTVKIGKGSHAGADFRIIDWIDHSILIPSVEMLNDYDVDRIALGNPDDNNVLIGWVSASNAILKHVNDLDLEHSRSKSPSSIGVV